MTKVAKGEVLGVREEGIRLREFVERKYWPTVKSALSSWEQQRARSILDTQILPTFGASSWRVSAAIAVFHMDNPIDDPDAWLPAMQDLVAVGRPAVPALSAELTSAKRAFEQSATSIALRAIGVPSVELLDTTLGPVKVDDDLTVPRLRPAKD